MCTVQMMVWYSERIYKDIKYAEFNANHPFVFVLINRSEDVMFTGRFVG